MKPFLRALSILVGGLVLAAPLLSQQTGAGTPGGTYTGPGDVTPGEQPPTGGNRDGGNVAVPGFNPNNPGGTGAPGSPFAKGANPLVPRALPPDANNPGSGNRAPAPPSPASRPRVENPNSWQIWWHYNRWAHLDVQSNLAYSGTGGFYLGRGEKSQVSPLLKASQAQMRDVVQPTLIQALLHGGQTDFQIFTLHAWAKLRDVPPDERFGSFADIVPSMMVSGNQNVAEKAVLALGIRGEDRFAPWLIAILTDSPGGHELVGRSRIGVRMRSFAAYALGLMAERTRDPEVRVAIYEALSKALWIERDDVQAACLLGLGLNPMPLADDFVEGGELFQGKTRVDQVLELLAFFEDTEQSLVARSQAPNALARLVADAPESLRLRVVYAFLVATGPHSREPREVQNGAVIALGQIGRSGAEPVDSEIRSHLERVAYRSRGDRSTRYFAMIALAEAAGRGGRGEEPFAGLEPTRRSLIRYLGRSRGETQAWTALAIGVLEEDAAERGEIASPEAGRALRHIFQRTRSHEVAGALAIAMGMLRDQESQEILLERMLTAGEERVRGYTALALGMLGTPGSITDIRTVLTRSRHQAFLVENAAIALALLGDQSTGSTMFSLLEQSSIPPVQASIASAMGWIKDPRPVAQLCDQLIDTRKNDTARAWTSVAIGRICDQDSWPWVGRLSVNVNYDVYLPTLLEPAFQTGLLDLP